MPNPKPLPALSESDIARFHSKIDRRGPDDCWEWLGSRFDGGYGRFKARRRDLKSSRVAYFLATGVDPGESLALHTCDNPPCCNPDHVYAGTPKDNTGDAIIRGRLRCGIGETHGSRTHPESRARGERAGGAKLTESQVREMRDLYVAGGHTHQSLADRFGICREGVGDILRGDNWGHIPVDRVVALSIGNANRAKPGESNFNAKLTATSVREIRRRYAAGGETYASLADAYGVTSVAIRFAVIRHTWKHVA